VDEDELKVLKEETLAALRALLQHVKACYGLVEHDAAA
jgi:hypothetical protein